MPLTVKMRSVLILNSLEVDGGSRVTRIGANGKSCLTLIRIPGYGKPYDRKEVLDAFEKGEGSAERLSATISKMTYYHAILLDDGSVIRLSFMSKACLPLRQSACHDCYPFYRGTHSRAITGRQDDRIHCSPLITPGIYKNRKKILSMKNSSPLLERIQKQNSEQKKNEQMRRSFPPMYPMS